ncbi:C-type lectin domain family 18 member B-like [Homalodisca vitripennis]|uniref:C-type lectin domain family 18 member B-like n=1 Tax=Homalodisca vitripennis TaxID=197043 RepID=UPI001EEAE59C|nr:C-type lectin domain family 18 member B-like [Homalodisca vitripennis]
MPRCDKIKLYALIAAMPQCLTQNDCPDVLTCIDMKCVDPCPGPCAQNSSCRVHKHVPFCSCSPGQILQTKCLENADCPLDRACIKQKCEDPCYNICNGNNTSCRVRNHIPYCTCKEGFYGDPLTACNQQYLAGSWPPFPGAKKRYEVETVKANWYGAMVHCMKHGGRLATISNFEENEIVKSKINKSGQKPQFWTSGMNYPLTETWTWMSTGQPLTYTDWIVGQPDSWLNLVVGEHCLELWEAGHYRWNDRNCLDILYFICEYYD